MYTLRLVLLIVCYEKALQISLCASSSNSKKNIDSQKAITSQVSTSSSRSSLLDEILSRPALPLPAVLTDKRAACFREKASGLSRKEVQAIYMEHITEASKSRSLAQAEASFESEAHISAGGSTDFEDDSSNTDDESEESFEEDDESTNKWTIYGSKVPPSSSSDRRQRHSRQRIARDKAIFQRAWDARGLNCEMEGQALAMAFTKLKIDLLEYDNGASMGNFAAAIIRKGKSREEYIEYRFWNRRYKNRLKHSLMMLNEKEKLTGPIPLEEKKKILYKKINKSQSRTYDDWNRRTPSIPKAEVDAMIRAKRAGDQIKLAARRSTGNPNLQVKDLSIAELEFYSRRLDKLVVNGEAQITRESTKKYLRKYLKKSEKDLNEFSKLRLEHKLATYNEKQRERRARLRQSRLEP